MGVGPQTYSMESFASNDSSAAVQAAENFPVFLLLNCFPQQK